MFFVGTRDEIKKKSVITLLLEILTFKLKNFSKPVN